MPGLSFFHEELGPASFLKIIPRLVADYGLTSQPRFEGGARAALLCMISTIVGSFQTRRGAFAESLASSNCSLVDEMHPRDLPTPPGSSSVSARAWLSLLGTIAGCGRSCCYHQALERLEREEARSPQKSLSSLNDLGRDWCGRESACQMMPPWKPR